MKQATRLDSSDSGRVSVQFIPTAFGLFGVRPRVEHVTDFGQSFPFDVDGGLRAYPLMSLGLG